jgi:hypothetical protein
VIFVSGGLGIIYIAIDTNEASHSECAISLTASHFGVNTLQGDKMRRQSSSPQRWSSARHICKCTPCIKENPNGCELGSAATLYAHKREEKLRQSLASEGLDELGRATTLRTISSNAASRPPVPPNNRHPLSTEKPSFASSGAVSKPTDSQQASRILQAFQDLKLIRDQFVQASLSYNTSGHLSFLTNPSESGPYSRQDGASGVNSGLHALRLESPTNQAYLRQETILYTLLEQLDGVPSCDMDDIKLQRKSLVDKVTFELDRLDHVKEQEWESQRTVKSQIRTVSFQTHTVDTGVSVPFVHLRDRLIMTLAAYFAQPHHTWHPVVLACYLVVLVMSLICHLPRRGADLLLAGLRCILRLATAMQMGQDDRLANAIPKSIKTVFNAFDIEPRTTSLICCPECYCLYPDTEPYISMCTYKFAKDSAACDAKLFRKVKVHGREYMIPVRKYLHQGMKDWMGRFLSRNGVESLMESTTMAAAQAAAAKGPLTGDILESLGLRSFLGHDGKPFLEAPVGESRYLFSLSADAFNPLGNKEAKQKVSSTGIYLVCLNLPIDIRHNPENMYLVGIIPGPGKPSLTEINHFLKLLVADLKDFWNPGIYFSRTAKYEGGRLVRAALVPVVCDALGARQIVGVGSVTSQFFCTFCFLSIQEIENFDRATWPLRDPQEHRQIAREWLDADTHARQLIFKQTGVRWSELLELPYWNPVSFLVVDSMHNLYLGLLQRHCRDIWGMNIKHDDGDGTTNPKGSSPPLPSFEAMQAGQAALNSGSRSKLVACTRPVLWYLCEERGLRRAGTKQQLTGYLLEWVSLAISNQIFV